MTAALTAAKKTASKKPHQKTAFCTFFIAPNVMDNKSLLRSKIIVTIPFLNLIFEEAEVEHPVLSPHQLTHLVRLPIRIELCPFPVPRSEIYLVNKRWI